MSSLGIVQNRHTSRMSAACIFKFLFKYIAEEDKASRLVFFKLCDDDSALVRRSAVSVLSELVNLMPVQEVMSEIFPIYQRIALDDQDNVRIQFISLSVSLASILPVELKVSRDCVSIFGENRMKQLLSM